MRTLMLYAGALIRWLAEASLLWLALAMPGAAIIAILWVEPSERTVRLIGLALELLGIGTVAWAIRSTRLFFGRPGLIVRARSWLSRRPRFRQDAIAAGAAITLASAIAAGRGYGWRGVGENATLEDRVVALEKNVKAVDERLNTTQKELDDGLRDLNDRLKRESESRSAEHGQIVSKLETSETSGLDVSAMGTLWLVIGLVLTTIPEEIAWVVR